MIHSVLPNLLLVCSIDMANEGSAAPKYKLLSTITSLGFHYLEGTPVVTWEIFGWILGDPQVHN